MLWQQILRHALRLHSHITYDYKMYKNKNIKIFFFFYFFLGLGSRITINKSNIGKKKRILVSAIIFQKKKGRTSRLMLPMQNVRWFHILHGKNRHKQLMSCGSAFGGRRGKKVKKLKSASASGFCFFPCNFDCINFGPYHTFSCFEYHGITY